MIEYVTYSTFYFTNRINKFISENFINKNDIISITANNEFTTLWYFKQTKTEL